MEAQVQPCRLLFEEASCHKPDNKAERGYRAVIATAESMNQGHVLKKSFVHELICRPYRKPTQVGE